MKNILFLFMFFVITSCKSQEVIIDGLYKTDIVLWTSKDKLEVNYIKNNIIHETGKNIKTKLGIKEIYNNHNTILLTNKWINDFMAIERYYSFIKDNDTMTIKCRCGQERNYYFKNLKFKKGSFELKFESSKQEIKGKQLQTPKEVQNMLFKNAFVWWENKRAFKDLYFRDLKFIGIDLNDTINVKLNEIKTSANKLLPKAGLKGLE